MTRRKSANYFKDPEFVSLVAVTSILLAASLFSQRWIGTHLPLWLAYMNIGALVVFIASIVRLPFWPARFMWSYTVLGLSILSASFHKVIGSPYRLMLLILILLVPVWVAIQATWFSKGKIWAKLSKDPEFLGVLAVILLLIPVSILSQRLETQQWIETYLPTWLAFINIGLVTVCLVFMGRLPFRSAWFLWVGLLLGLSIFRASLSKILVYPFISAVILIGLFGVNGYVRMRSWKIRDR